MAQKKLKQENYVTIADFMVASLERDLADFTAIYKTINKRRYIHIILHGDTASYLQEGKNNEKCEQVVLCRDRRSHFILCRCRVCLERNERSHSS